ncbi:MULTISPECIES: Tex family protein [Lactococcus]|uniref:Transcription accessory protein (S1 RNA-binding domain) n=2 Tax=Lactococcus lactis TaxID=1358 RepID=A0A0V8EBD3_LACLL|nr:Tex family protein [Lactococcus lactis]MBK0083523.1 RNA-binding transcriptional accessory protein [Lactococcus sp. S64]KSU07708.1 Transcription accessory protein (S1 RNA-binding domain) [Lactococcus lactis subsp. lactis]KSU23182.1 Transcription accessory protein (S1 RNA-binding domain) [Lactococcus lactis subsp. lactis]MBK5075511.1 RNA-binding transcriptional accessory protein [Lactococcus lactis]MCG1000859.1 RNA-binding transcriptional accessory protein [Lactococcus lactis]
MENVKKIAELLNINNSQVEKVLELTAEGNTVPFIARYRKEATGSLDEVEIKKIIDEDNLLTKLSERKTAVLSKIEELGKLTDSLKAQILAAEKLTEVEDLYLPYKEKRRTKATIAKENGLFPLAQLIVKNSANLEEEAEKFVNENFTSPQKALEGAVDILSEAISEDARLRSWLTGEIKNNSLLTSSLKKDAVDEKQVFQMYYEFSEKVSELPNYRVLALNRGEKLGILSVKFENNEDKILRYFAARFAAQNNPMMQVAIKDAVKKKLIPAMERSIRTELTEKAEASAIEVFGENLKNLLLVAPLKGRVVMGFDPAYRTGAKLAIVDETGKLLMTTVIYPVKPANAGQIAQAKKDLAKFIREYGVNMIAIGNGTASRESESFVAEVLKENNFSDVYYVIVSESGASVYSASELAREEFPELTVEKRSAISIARRLQDPLAELVKIEPKAIGVGQYQHDVSEKKLTENLDFVVETVVNQVGVNVNTASPSLLSHVAGLNKSLAQNVVKYREENGALKTRAELKKVPRLGAKAFEQAAGFLRIPEGKNFLDNTGVHPESYKVTEQLLAEISADKPVSNEELLTKLSSVNIPEMAEKLGLGQETLTDIINDLQKPGRDLRDSFDAPILRQDVLSAGDLQIGQQLEGVVRNVVDFGAFIDIGIKNDGLAHVSDLSKSFVKNPSDVVAVGQIVTVWVKSLDLQRGKINLTLVNPREK